MKNNVHILPTNKPSRLHLWFKELKLTKDYQKLNYDNEVNIYITNDEEIKEGDWCIHTELHVLYFKDNNSIEYPAFKKYYKKIILTDNQDLIKDGVQAIDDDFLEWFVKNPSCESIEVNLLPYDGTKSISKYWGGEYKIIIPQEEPKIYNIQDLQKAFLKGYVSKNNKEDYPFALQKFLNSK
jgi:hypothetical protein